MHFIPLEVLLSFIMTCTIIELSPGPNMAYLAVLSASDGRKAGFAATAGIALGLLSIGLAAALGVAALISNSVFAYQALRIGGVLYLLWLAWDGWKKEDQASPDQIKVLHHNAKFFKRGLIVNILNPKAAVFYIAILPKFITNDASLVVSQAATLTVIYVAIATIIHTTIVFMAGAAHDFLQDDRRRLIARRVLSLALAMIAIWFAYSTNI